MRHVLASAFAALTVLSFVLPSPALAQEGGPKLSNPKAIVDTVTPELVQSIVTEMGGKDVQIRESENGKVVTFSVGSLPYVFGVSGCEVKPGKCMTLVMLVFVDMGATGITADMINTRNNDSFFATSVKIDDKVIAFGRGVLVDGGVTRENLSLNIAIYASLVREGIKHFGSQVVAARNMPATMQNLSWGQAQVRPILPTPQQLNSFMKSKDLEAKTSGRLGTSW